MALAIGTFMPSFELSTSWLDEAIKPHGRHLTLIHFWAVSCPICKQNMPRLLQLLQTHMKNDLQIISVHMPRMKMDMDIGRVRAFMNEVGWAGPCAIDNTHTIGDRFQTGNIWPSYFLFDAKGRLRSRAAGALGLKLAENSLKRMLEVEEKEVAAA